MTYMTNRLTSVLMGTLLLAGITGLSGCSNIGEDPIFEKPALERAADLAKQCEETLLAAPHGWEMAYKVPSIDLDATFHAQLKFEEGKKVTIWTDYLDEPVVSTYRMSLYEGAMLTFDTPGALTELANPANYPNEELYGNSSKEKSGYYGENDFVIVSVAPDKVVLRGLKYGLNSKAEDIVLTKLDQPASMSNNGIDKVYNKVYYRLTRWGGIREVWVGKDFVYSISLDIPTWERFVVELPVIPMSLLDAEGNPVGEERQVTITDNGDGIRITPGIEYEGKVYTDFVFDESRAGYVTEGSDLWINLSPIPDVVLKLRQGGFYTTAGFFAWSGDAADAHPLVKPLLGKEPMEALLPGFVEFQWYVYPDLKGFDYLYKDAEGNAQWPGIEYDLVELTPSEGIYQIRVTNYHDLLQSALQSDSLNGINIFAVFFTSLGGDTNRVQITEVIPNEVVRITELNSGYNLWIDFPFYTN